MTQQRPTGPTDARAGSAAVNAHVDVIDAVRGFAALVVAYMHCREINWIGLRAHFRETGLDLWPQSLLAWATAPFAWGSIGVPILFVVSGYVIHRRSARQMAAGRLDFSTPDFLLRRLIRIYPTFLAAIFLTFVCDYFTRGIVDHPKLGDASFKTLLGNVLGLQGILSGPWGSNGPLWSLAIEIQFYAFYPLALALRSRIGATPMLLAAAVPSLLGWLFLERRGLAAFPQFYLSWWIGAWLADREAASESLPGWWLALPVVFIPAGAYFTSEPSFLNFTLWSIGVAPVLAWLVASRSRLARVRTPLHVCGDFSYSIYVTHLPVVVLANALLFGGAKPASILYSFGIATGAVAVAWLFYLVAERPFVRLLGRLPR